MTSPDVFELVLAELQALRSRRQREILFEGPHRVFGIDEAILVVQELRNRVSIPSHSSQRTQAS